MFACKCVLLSIFTEVIFIWRKGKSKQPNNNRLKKKKISDIGMTVSNPPGYRNSQSTSVAQEDTLDSEMPLQVGLCDLPTPWSKREDLGTATCWSFAVDRERMLRLKSGLKEDIPCFRVLEIWTGP